MELERDRDKLEVEIAEKRIELYNIQADDVAGDPESAGVPSTQPDESEAANPQPGHDVGYSSQQPEPLTLDNRKS